MFKKMISSYIVFVVVGNLGAWLCPSVRRTTGVAHNPFGDGYLFSYEYLRDPTELFSFISISIIVAAIILSLKFASMDKKMDS